MNRPCLDRADYEVATTRKEDDMRNARNIFVFAIGATLGWGGQHMAATDGATGVIETDRIVVRDDRGVARVEIGSVSMRDETNAFGITLSGPDGEPVALLFSDEERSSLILQNPRSDARLWASAESNGSFVHAAGKDATVRATLGAHNLTGYLTLYDEDDGGDTGTRVTFQAP